MDPEAQAIDEAWSAISRLPPDGRMRVIRYLAGRAAIDAAGQAFGRDPDQYPGGEQPELGLYGTGTEAGNVAMSDRLRAIFEDRNIATVANKILIAAALIQEQSGGKPLSAREIHEPLKESGVPVTNISAHLNAIGNRGGRRQLTKITEKNRHHRYQVTAIGMRTVKQLLGNSQVV